MCQAYTYTLNSLKYVTLISWLHHGTAGQANQDDRPHPLLPTVVPLLCRHQETGEDHRVQDDSGNRAPLAPSGALSLTSPQCLWILGFLILFTSENHFMLLYNLPSILKCLFKCQKFFISFKNCMEHFVEMSIIIDL